MSTSDIFRDASLLELYAIYRGSDLHLVFISSAFEFYLPLLRSGRHLWVINFLFEVAVTFEWLRSHLGFVRIIPRKDQKLIQMTLLTHQFWMCLLFSLTFANSLNILLVILDLVTFFSSGNHLQLFPLLSSFLFLSFVGLLEC